MKKNSKLLITGSKGMVGKSLVKKLNQLGYTNLLLPASKELDLRNQVSVDSYFAKWKIEYVFHLAAKVGGIAANIESPAEFMYDNLIMGCNVINAAKVNKVKKLLFLGSSCIYPRECPQPMKEKHLLTGKLEPTNEGYALSKICGLKLCEFFSRQYKQNFISLMPPNLYGPHDHYNSRSSHVMSSLISKFHHAKKNNLPQVEIWGTGNPRREFLYTEDLVEALVFFMQNCDYDDDHPFINVGTGDDITIRNLAKLIKEIVGYDGKITFNTKMKDGMMRKKMDVSLANSYGWKSKTVLEEGIKKTYKWFLENEES